MLLAAAVLALGPWSPRAEACSGPGCDGRVQLGGVGDGGVPASAPGLAVSPVWFGDGAFPSAVLRRADGGVVPTQAAPRDAELVVAPTDPLEPGDYTLTVESRCSSMEADAGVTTELPVRVEAAAPLPTGLGTFGLAGTGTGPLPFPSGGPCAEDGLAAFARFAWTPSPELRPFLPLTRWTLRVGDRVWARTRFGGLRADGTETASAQAGLVRAAYTNWPLLQVQALCGGPTHLEPGLAPGMHSAVLEAEIAGGPTLVSAPVAFTLECGKLPTLGEDVRESGCAASPAALALVLLGLLAPVVARRVRG